MATQHISNPSATAHLVTIKVDKIASPYSMSPLHISENEREEITFTPARILQPAGNDNFVKFYYNGPHDDQERYYRVTWLDDPLSENGKNSAEKTATLHAIASIGTVLVVAPRIANFSYKYQAGELKNTGNISFRMVAYGPCKKGNKSKNICHVDGPVGPGKVFSFKTIDMTDSNAHLGVWEGKQLIPVDLINANT